MMMFRDANKQKGNKQLINTYHDARKTKKYKHVENAFLFFEERFSFWKTRTTHVRGQGGHLKYSKKIFVKTNTALRSKF